MDKSTEFKFTTPMHFTRLFSGTTLMALVGISTMVAQPAPTSRLANDLANYAKQGPSAPVITAPETAPELDEAREIARLEALAPVKMPIQDAALYSAIEIVGQSAGMNMIAPTQEDFGESVTITATINPWKMLQLMAERYRFSMRFHSGVWMFSRESAGALIGKTYILKYANLDKLESSAEQGSDIGQTVSTSGNQGGRSVGQGFGLVYKVDTSKVIDDLRILIGLPRLSSQTMIVKGSDLPNMDAASVAKIAGMNSDSSNVASGAARVKDDGQRVLYLPNTNALYVVCYRSQHEHVAEYLSQLDQPPIQMKIEARLFATTENPETILGIDYTNAMPNIGLSNIQTNVDLGHIRHTRWPAQTVLSSSNLAVQLDALEKSSNSQQIQAPFVVTMNNHEAMFSVGQEEPFLDSSTLSPGAVDGGLGSTTNRISVKRIGTAVNVVPTYFKGSNGEKGHIRLAIKMEVGRLTGYRQVTPQVSYPIVDSQKYEFTVTIEEGQAIAFGGLTGLETANNTNGVPGISRIPILGALFRHKDVSNQQRKLIGYLVPTVVHDAPVEVPPMQLSLNETKK